MIVIVIVIVLVFVRFVFFSDSLTVSDSLPQALTIAPSIPDAVPATEGTAEGEGGGGGIGAAAAELESSVFPTVDFVCPPLGVARTDCRKGCGGGGMGSRREG